jgi:ankyrin repeat protein
MNNEATPLFVESQNGHLGIVDSLIYSGASVDNATFDKWTPLIIAAHNGYLDIVLTLLAAGANVAHETSNYDTALSEARRRGHPDVVDVISETMRVRTSLLEAISEPFNTSVTGRRIWRRSRPSRTN